MKPELRKSKAGSRTISIIAAAIVILAGLSVLLVLWQRHSAFLILWQRHSASVEGQARATLHLESNSFVSGGAIPRRYTCDGSNDSPGLQWAGAPAGTKSFALVMNDPDAPIDFTHWLAYNIPPGFRGLAEGASGHSVMPQGSAEGTNNFGRLGYGGPCPPAGQAPPLRIPAVCARCPAGFAAGRDERSTGVRDRRACSGRGRKSSGSTGGPAE